MRDLYLGSLPEIEFDQIFLFKFFVMDQEF